MSQPPYPPQGGSDMGGERSGAQGWNHPGDDDATRQFGPQYGQPAQYPYGPPQYGPAPGQPPYPQYGQPQYALPQYPLPQYPQYGQPAYGRPPYGPPWGPPAGPGGPWPRKNRNAVIALIVGLVVVVAVVGAGLFFLLRAGDTGPEAAGSSGSSRATDDPAEPAPSGGGELPAAAVSPDGLGDDPELDELAQECYRGDMAGCDELYELAELDSLYALYGGTCGGRQRATDAETVFCSDAFPGN